VTNTLPAGCNINTHTHRRAPPCGDPVAAVFPRAGETRNTARAVAERLGRDFVGSGFCQVNTREYASFL